ncbi:MAG: hypothetical protein M3Y13_09210 [Armatimonadota bacterium]|nr:hypothetical protein [Armatimonadota bacterium]
MNFLSHYALALRICPSAAHRPLFVAGNALPDLLPPATPRLRPKLLDVPTQMPEEAAVRAGVAVHLATDAAFHKTASFAEMQAEAADRLRQAGFKDMRVRVFFVAHILVELVLDAALLRADGDLADRFYADFCAADAGVVTRWAEAALGKPLPTLPAVLARFGAHQYLRHYSTDQGVAEGLTRVCGRARQDMFEGDNLARLTDVVVRMGERVAGRAADMLEETAQGIGAGNYSASRSWPCG